ncbi:hypothetical protein SAMN05428970_2817 [Agromyces sp. CF514]|uniref:hypothetical protein n=1 Tax=Agromyces sp. CF514 TaxID=1881031 RepID=UPI0008E855A3|nr:hypothetical protein [Agromyces sp. CF514]SFR83525.1 hypothetical protein SAMN05428970_2817 [Agromyces sp. CF514]
MAGFLVRRTQAARELQAHDAELAKRAASALLAVDEGIRIASDEIAFAEAELGSESIDGAWALIAVVRRDLSDAFRLNRLNHDAMPGTPDEVRARYVLILRLCEWAEQVLGALTSTLADRVARARWVPAVVPQSRADAAGGPPPIVIDGMQAHLVRLRAARSALDAATTAAHQGASSAGLAMRAMRPRPSLVKPLQRALADADRSLDAAREAVTSHRGWIGAEALTRLAEAEHVRIDLRHCLGGGLAGSFVSEEYRTLATAMAQNIAALAGEALLLARRDLDASRRALARM